MLRYYRLPAPLLFTALCLSLMTQVRSEDNRPVGREALRSAPLDMAWSDKGDRLFYLLPSSDEGEFGLYSVDLNGRKRLVLRGIIPKNGRGGLPGSGLPKASTDTPTPSPTPSPTPKRVTPSPSSQLDKSDPISFYEAVISGGDGDTSQGLKVLKTEPKEEPALALAPRPSDTPKTVWGAPSAEVDLRGFQLSPNADKILINTQGDLVLVDLGTGEVQPLTNSPSKSENNACFTPSGDALVYEVEGHVYRLDLLSRASHRLTEEAGPKILQGQVDGTYEALYSPRQAEPISISPDGTLVAYLRLDLTGMTGAAHPGDPLPTPSLHVVSSAGELRVSHMMEGGGYLMPAFSFTPDGRHLAFMELDRQQETLKLMWIDTKSGEVEVLLEETMPHFYPPPERPYFLPNGEQFIWMSPYYGFTQPHLGHVKKGKDRPKRLLKDPWNLNLLAMDPKGKWMYLRGSGEVPTEHYLYKMHPKGGGLTRMTLRWGWHDVMVSPTGSAFVDTFSDPNTAPVTTVWRERERVREIENRKAALKSEDFGRSTYLRFPSEDEQQVFALLRQPSGGGSHPLIIRMAQGPGHQSVSKRYVPDAVTYQFLQAGVAVLLIDPRGSGGRKHRFSTAIDGQPGVPEMEDLVRTFEKISNMPGIDSDMIFVMGEGYGGYLALKSAALELPIEGIIAVNAITDFEAYSAPISERYLGDPTENWGVYNTLKLKKNTSDNSPKVLLVVSAEDEVVDSAQSTSFLEAQLTSSNAPELLWVPGGEHAIFEQMPQGDYAMAHILDFLGHQSDND